MENKVPDNTPPAEITRKKEALQSTLAGSKGRVQAFFDHLDSVCDFTALGIDRSKLPTKLNASQYIVLDQIFKLATQSAEVMAKFKCPECSHVFKDITIDTKLERNKLQALSMLADRFAPKLQTIDTNININLVVTSVVTSLIAIVQKYVPNGVKEKMLDEFDTEFQKIERQIGGESLGASVLTTLGNVAPSSGVDKSHGLGGFKV